MKPHNEQHSFQDERGKKLHKKKKNMKLLSITTPKKRRKKNIQLMESKILR